jgi:hypothetical protein
MALEDVYYLKKHSIKESYMFYVDSQFRDKSLYHTPSQYEVKFDSPFKNVYAVEVLDASIPRTEYSIDNFNNLLVFFWGSVRPSSKDLKKIYITPGDYSDVQLIEEINKQFIKAGINMTINNVSDPGNIESTFRFIGGYEFVLDMELSTINTTLGFDEYSIDNNKTLYDIFNETTVQYSIDKDNNVLVIIIESNIIKVTISVGSYTHDEIVIEINKQFSSASIPLRISSNYDSKLQYLLFKFTSEFDFYFNMELSTLFKTLKITENGNNIPSKEKLFSTKLSINNRCFKSIQVDSFDPIKYDSYNELISGSTMEGKDFEIKEEKAIYQKFEIAAESDGSYGYISKIEIHLGNNDNLEFKIAIIKEETGLNNEKTYIKKNLGDAETIYVNKDETIGIWTAPPNVEPARLDPGVYYIYIFGAGAKDTNTKIKLKLKTFSVDDFALTSVDNVSFNINLFNEVFDDSQKDVYLNFGVFNNNKQTGTNIFYSMTSNNDYYRSGTPYKLFPNKEPAYIAYFVNGNGYENTESPTIILLKGRTYHIRYSDDVTKDNFPVGIYSETFGGPGAISDLLTGSLTGDYLGINVRYFYTEVVITISADIDINKLPLELNYMSQLNSEYVGNKLKIVDSSSVAVKEKQSIIFRIETNERPNIVTAPGQYSLTGDRYVILRCPEIEQHLYRSRSYERYTMGLAKFKLSTYGYDDTTIDFAKIPVRTFHPIGKLNNMTFRFEKSNGELYNFRGLNHTLTLAIRYYTPIQRGEFTNFQLNPNYDPEYFRSIQNDESSDEMSDSESD